MARGKNGNGRLEESVVALNQSMVSLNQSIATMHQSTASLNQSTAALNQAMATFLARMAETDARMAETDKEIAQTNRINSERFARIEAILMEHSRILIALPDAIRDKIGSRLPSRERRSDPTGARY